MVFGLWIKSVLFLGFIQSAKQKYSTRHIGIQTALTSDTEQEKKIDCLILLSGIEEQRQRLEKALLERNWPQQRRVVLVRGVLDVKENCKHPSLEIQNYATPKQLGFFLNPELFSVDLVFHLMDLDSFAIKKLLIPTPGQTNRNIGPIPREELPGTLVPKNEI